MDAHLTCPQCRSVDRFTILATVKVEVDGAHFLEPYAEECSRTYGSDSLCICGACAHEAPMAAFMTDVTDLLDYLASMAGANDQAGDPSKSPKASVHPIRPPP
jgi:hypothetical protein